MEFKQSILTEREIEILELLSTGKTNKEIAQVLYITENTVETHLRHIFRKIGVKNRLQVGMYYRDNLLNKEQNIITEIHDNKISDFRDANMENFHRIAYSNKINSKFIQEVKVKLKDWFVSIAVGLVIGILAFATGFTKFVLFPQLASAKASVPDIISLMANSHTKWTSLSADAVTVWHLDNQNTQTVNTSILIQQPNRIRLELEQFDKDGQLIVDMTWLMNDEVIYEQDNLRKQYTEYQIPGFAKMSYSDFISSAPKVNEPVIYRHPIAMLMPSPIADYLYPGGLVQRAGIYSVENVSDQVSKRGAVILDWQKDQTRQSQFKYWVDTEKGVILKAQVLNPDGSLFEDTAITNIDFDAVITNDTFVLSPPSDFTFVPYSEFGSH